MKYKLKNKLLKYCIKLMVLIIFMYDFSVEGEIKSRK